MHHGNPEDNDALREFWMSIPAKEYADMKLGATGMFPEGKLVDSDEGEIRFGVTHKDGKVVFDFGTTVRWFAMSPGQAIELANTIKKHALLGRK